MVYVFKTLRRKSDKHFCKYLSGEIYLCEIPELLSKKATMNDMINYASKFDNAVGIKWENYEIIEIEVNGNVENKRNSKKWVDHSEDNKI